tara:strand:- start:5530 stop:6660 length:1131 start_codon:yes stop_codon:yes gene_type:complete
LTSKPAGLGVFVDSLVSSLQDKKIEITIITEEIVSKENQFYDQEKINYVEIIPKKLKFLPRIFKKIFRLVWINLSLSRILKNEKINILLSMTFEAPLLMSERINYGMVIGDLTALFYSGKEFLLERIYLNLYLKHCLKNISYIVVPSKSTYLSVIKKYSFIKKEKITIIPEGFDKNNFFLPSDKEKSEVRKLYSLPKKYFLYSGSLLAHKNLKVLLKSIQKINNLYPEIQLIIIGPASSKEIHRIKVYAEKLSITRNINHLGYVPRDHMRVLMHCSNAFLFPSKSEGFGLSVLEAMASGAYVISSNATSLPEVLGSSGKLISPDNENAWTIEMQNSLNDDFILRDCNIKRVQAAQRATLFSWEITAKNILKVLEKK